MGTLIESRKSGPWTIEKYYDEAGEWNNPRDWDGSFLWCGFPHRRYEFGDEQLDPERDITLACARCGGSGELEDPDQSNDIIECPDCGGSGVADRQVTWNDVVDHLKRTEGAHVVRMVSCTDHSGLSFNLGAPRDPWDSGVAGALVFTQRHADEWGLAEWTEDDIVEQMKAEIGQYDAWSNGQVFGYRIRDINGDEVDSCWGFVGWEDFEEALKGAVEGLPDEPPAKLHTLRVTTDEIQLLLAGLSAIADQCGTIDTIVSKLTNLEDNR